MMATDHQRLLADIVAIARQAGAEILDVYESDFEVMTKEDQSPLTRADLASHTVIRAELNRLTPCIPFLSEESTSHSIEERRSWSEYWLVDPLDGTKEFVHRNGEFTVNIALIRDHEPVLGVVHVPVRGQTYSGIVGAGSWRADGQSPPVPIQTRKPPPNTPVVVGSRSHANPKLAECLANIGAYKMVSMGSSLKFCLVAEGAADLYPRLGPTSEWDTAAAQAVVVAAGGTVVNLAGEPLQYNMEDDILNPWFIVLGDPGAGWMERLNRDI